jgi:hypothetical protein
MVVDCALIGYAVGLLPGFHFSLTRFSQEFAYDSESFCQKERLSQ